MGGSECGLFKSQKMGSEANLTSGKNHSKVELGIFCIFHILVCFKYVNRLDILTQRPVASHDTKAFMAEFEDNEIATYSIHDLQPLMFRLFHAAAILRETEYLSRE